MCYYGRPVIDEETGKPIIDKSGKAVVEHDAHTVPKFTAAAQHCGYASRQSLYDMEKKGGLWAEVVGNFRDCMEDWYIGRGVSPRKGDNPPFMGMILQARFNYQPASKQVHAGDGKSPLNIIHDTPDDVKRVISSLKLESTAQANLPAGVHEPRINLKK